jgi:hypothetical protein
MAAFELLVGSGCRNASGVRSEPDAIHVLEVEPEAAEARAEVMEKASAGVAMGLF